jgi:MFS family permease
MDEERQNTRRVFWLGMVSFFNDLSSEVVGRVLPLYLILVVNTSMAGVGLIEAISEGTAIFARLFTGYFSDRIARRKPFIFGGYTLSVLSRPLILISPTIPAIAMARFADRVGKGIRTPPRDALVADLSNERNRGHHFGILRGLDTLGAVLGSLGIALFLQTKLQADEVALRQVLWIASSAGVLALFVLWFGVSEPQRKAFVSGLKFPSLSFKGLDRRLQYYLVVAFLFALATSSDAFLIVKARERGFTISEIFFILTGLNIVAAISSYFLSKLSDTWGRKKMLIIGWTLYAACYFLFGLTALSSQAFIAIICVYGLFYGFTEGAEKALIADFTTDPEKRGQAYGWLGLVMGLGIIPANLVFGLIYQRAGAAYAFWFSALFAILGVLALLKLKLHEIQNSRSSKFTEF